MSNGNLVRGIENKLKSLWKQEKTNKTAVSELISLIWLI
jgi:hypothetical protein